LIESSLFLVSEIPHPPFGNAPKMAEAQPRDNRVRVLVVDDERLITDSICTILKQNGFDAIGAYSGAEAIAAARKATPDIVLSDVLMPKMSGVELGIQLRKDFPGLRVLLFSGQAQTAAMIQRAQVEGYHFELCPKPIHPDELLAKLKGY
jgi:DNA-binding response OmpR family regulator